MSRRMVVTASALLALSSTPALAWGQNGHRIIGDIAQEKISGKTAAEIELILGVEDLAEASTWADEERSNPAAFWQKEAGPYHYVTVPRGKTYGEVGAPPEGDAITALRKFSETVRNPHASRKDKALALRFIIHIVGDLHQPLHAGDGADRGGNDVKVRWFGDETNLHSVWDTQMIEGQNLSYTEHADRLDRAIGPAEIIAWWKPDPLVWIAESTAIRATIYPPNDAAPPSFSYGYQYQHLPTAERRLQQAGVRLAAYLDELMSAS